MKWSDLAVASAAILALSAQQQLASAKCLGSSCTGLEETVDTGSSSNTCRGRDRTFDFDPKWRTQLQSQLQIMEWSGGDDQWVWAVTTGSTADMAEGQFHHIYWSDDHGKTMKDRFEDLKQLVKDKIGSGYEPSKHDLHASVSKIFVNKKDSKRVVLWGEGSYAYESKDGGKTLEIVSVPENTFGMSHQVRQHPTQADWMLSLAYRNSCYDYSSPGCSMDLWLTKDFARTWTNLTEKAGGAVSGFLDFDWGYHTDDPKYADMFEEGTILATGHTNEYKTTLDVVSEDIALYRSDDDFKTFDKLATCGAAFELVAGQVFFVHPDVCTLDVRGKSITPKSNRRNALTLYVSSNGRDFNEVCMPTELSDSAYTMISTQDGRGCFMIADHVDKEAAISNMYANGNIAELYTLSLRNVHFGFSRMAKPDILPLKPIPGRYIANQLESSVHDDLPQRVNDLDFNAVTVTKVTHNAGASWNLIAVDPKNVKNEVCKRACHPPDGCYLHLHGASSWIRGTLERPSVYSAQSAPGLVMASGNLGPEKLGLKTDKDDLCTWLSRDGGITWTDVIDDVYIYEFLNHGNIIAMAKFREEGPAEYLHVSLDQGQCFYSIRLKPKTATDTELHINNILVEPDGAATIVHVTGSEHIKSLGVSNDVIFTIDLKEVLGGADIQGTTLPPRGKCDGNDFENWTASAENGSAECILGKEYTYRRVTQTNRAAACFLPKDYEMSTVTSTDCDCKKEDFYCEYGFEKQGSNSECTKMALGYAPVCEAIEIEAYQPSTSNLRLAHNQVCPNLKTFIPDTDGNGNMRKGEWTREHFNMHRNGHHGGGGGGKSKSGGGFFWFFMLLIIVAVAAVAGVAKYGPDGAKDAIASSVEAGISGVIWVVDGAKGLLSRSTGDNPEALGFERLGESNQQDLYAVP